MGQGYAELARLKDGPASDTLLEGIRRLKASVDVFAEHAGVMQVLTRETNVILQP